jgi:hypothetical protein
MPVVIAECEILDEPDEEDSVEVLRLCVTRMATQRCMTVLACQSAVSFS